MQSRQFPFAVLTIAIIAGTTTIAHAETRLEAIAEQTGLRSAHTQEEQTQATRPQPMQVFVNNGRTFFTHSPFLVRAATSNKGAHTPSTYEFTLTVPENAGQPLQAVTIAQAQNIETIRFNPAKSKAFMGQRFAAGPEIPLSQMAATPASRPSEVTVRFNQPVQPGSTVTVALQAQANPSYGGVYLFGVTAVPAGEMGLGQFLGYGRLHFYSSSN